MWTQLFAQGHIVSGKERTQTWAVCLQSWNSQQQPCGASKRYFQTSENLEERGLTSASWKKGNCFDSQIRDDCQIHDKGMSDEQ